jgi:hypothetical protein
MRSTLLFADDTLADDTRSGSGWQSSHGHGHRKQVEHMPQSSERFARMHVWGLAVAIAGLALLVAACGGGSSTTSASRTASPGAQQGIANICAQPTQVSSPVPSSIPAYPGAQLQVSDYANGHGEFGYCASASTSDVAKFYAAQLPTKGWQNVKSLTFGGVTQVTADKGNAQLIETAAMASNNSSWTNILIIVNGM